MKKLIALVLAIVLSLGLATVAFATEYGSGEYETAADKLRPGDKIVIKPGDFDTVDYTKNGSTVTVAVDEDYMSSDYFSIKVEYDRGKDLVKDVKFDDGAVVITLKDGVVEQPSVANFRIKSVTLTGKKNGIGDAKAYRSKKFELTDTAKNTFQTSAKVGYPVDKIAIADISADDDIIVKFDASLGDSYGKIIIDFDDVATAEVRVYKNEKFYFGTDSKADTDIAKANPDADLEFVNFIGRPSFSSNADVEIFASDDYKYIYEIKSGKLVTTPFKYDKDAAAFVGKTRTLGYYVMSDKKLKASSVAESSESQSKDENAQAANPDTGANTMVGVASALAIVSLVAAGAVSLKKK